jgi:hypothetical protein
LVYAYQDRFFYYLADTLEKSVDILRRFMATGAEREKRSGMAWPATGSEVGEAM